MKVLVFIALIAALSSASAAQAQTSGEPEEGREVFEANCAMCHGDDTSGRMGMHPSLRGAVERLTLDGVEVTIRNGRDTNPPMPAFEGRLTDEEIDDVIAYVDTLPVGPRNFGAEGGGMMDMDGMMGGGMLVGVIVFLLLIGAVVVAAVLAVRKFGRGSGGKGSRDDDPLSILKERYARGDIDHEEFEERRRVLQQ